MPLTETSSAAPPSPPGTARGAGPGIKSPVRGPRRPVSVGHFTSVPTVNTLPYVKLAIEFDVLQVCLIIDR